MANTFGLNSPMYGVGLSAYPYAAPNQYDPTAAFANYNYGGGGYLEPGYAQGEMQASANLLNTLLGQSLSGGFGILRDALNRPAERERVQNELNNRLALQNMQGATQLAASRINTQPALLNAKLNEQAYGRRNDLLNMLMGQPGRFTQPGTANSLQGFLPGLLTGSDGASAGLNPVNLAMMGAGPQSNYLSQLIAGAPNQFQGMPQGLFQQQLNQIMGGAAQGLGGQLRGANAGMAGAGMAVGSPVGQALQRQYANQALAGAQNAMTGAALNRQQQDFARQQAGAGYQQGLANMALGQQQQRQQFGLGLGQLGLGQQQARLQRQQLGTGLLGNLLG